MAATTCRRESCCGHQERLERDGTVIDRGKRRLRRLLRVVTIACSVLLLVAAAGGSYLWLLHARSALETYQPPIRSQPRPGGVQTEPLASQVILVIVDGLRDDAVAAMPTLSLLRRQGATARAIARPPTYSHPAWTTLVTGAWPELNGAPPLNAATDELRPIAVDHVLAAVARAGGSTALVGHEDWRRMIPPDTLDAHFYVDRCDAAADEQVADTALRFLRNFRPSLTLVYFGQVDEVAHQAGAAGHLYREATLHADDHLRDIVQAVDLRHAVIVVVSDHGHLRRGGHGGHDPEVVTTPFIAVGNSIVNGDYGTIAQTDIAPTIAAILGAPVPRLSQGRVRYEMLHTDALKRAQTQVGVALQRRDYGNLYLRSIGQGTLSETAEGDVAVAVSSLEVGNLESAFRLAGMASDRIDQEVAEARERRIQRERQMRLPLAAAAVGGGLALLLWRGGHRGLWLLMCAVVTLAVHNGLFLHQGNVYSFSCLTGLEPFLEQTATRVIGGSAAGALLVLWRLWRDREGSVLEVVQTGLGYALVVVYLLGCQAAVIYWLSGFRMTWYIPHFGLVFWQLVTLAQVPFTVAAGLVLPVLLVLCGLVYQAVTALGGRLRRAGGR